MLSKGFAGAMLATALSATIAGAQSIAQLGGPANLPPAGFTGQQFIDARGCVFLKAGFGNGTNWVPRVDRTHKPLCGFPPSFGTQVAAALQADMAPEAAAAAAQPAAPVIAAAPVVTAAAKPIRTAMAAPSPPPAPKVYPAAQPAAPAAAAARTGLFDFLFAGAKPSLAPAPQVVSLAAPSPVAAPLRLASTAIPKPPKGYKLAWKDDRLNPLRGIGTPAGQAAQDQIWTRDVPAVLVTAAIATTPRLATSVSTLSAPQTRAASTRSYLQIGSFGQPANADGVRARLTAVGLPVATSKITRGGNLLQVVYAGPFSSAASAQSALTTARSAGFPDAILK